MSGALHRSNRSVWVLGCPLLLLLGLGGTATFPAGHKSAQETESSCGCGPSTRTATRDRAYDPGPPHTNEMARELAALAQRSSQQTQAIGKECKPGYKSISAATVLHQAKSLSLNHVW